MAVDAHHLHLSPSQLLLNREFMNSIENQYGGAVQMLLPNSGNGSFLPLYNPVATTTTGDSGVTCNNIAASRKRDNTTAISFLGEDLSSLIHNQTRDVDRILAHHAEKVRAGIAERRRRFLAAVEGGIAKRMRAKEEEIERMGKINWALEERVRSLSVENQIWRELAQVNEAAASELKASLEQVLAAQQVRRAEEACGKDAESCCWGENGPPPPPAAAAAAEDGRRVCWGCFERESSVVLLPCRHMCLCLVCGPAVNTCPVCKCSKDGSVNVNIA